MVERRCGVTGLSVMKVCLYILSRDMNMTESSVMMRRFRNIYGQKELLRATSLVMSDSGILIMTEESMRATRQI